MVSFPPETEPQPVHGSPSPLGAEVPYNYYNFSLKQRHSLSAPRPGYPQTAVFPVAPFHFLYITHFSGSLTRRVDLFVSQFSYIVKYLLHFFHIRLSADGINFKR